MSYYPDYYDYPGYYDGVNQTDGTVFEDGTVHHYEHYYEVDLFVYQSFDFEWPIYLYFWAILVSLTTLANILVISVFIRKRMRNSTNVILMSIAISDSLTGVVTLPVYIYVYASAEKKNLHLTKDWCEAFMIVKLFASKAFHTMSIWLTVCLGFQRLVAVCFPFRAQSMFTMQRTIIMTTLIVILSPVLHIYHLFSSNAVDQGPESDGKECVWELEEPCEEGCIYLWLRFYLMYFIPCFLLVVFTAAMITVLCRTVHKMQSMNSLTDNGTLRRSADSRRISLTVVVVVVVFLIPEVPYGLYLLLSVTFHLSRVGLMDIRTNRIFHCVYEISLVLSFHANFWIYFIMNRRFRKCLRGLFLPVCVLCCGIVRTIRRRGSRIRRRTMSSSFGTNQHTQPTSGLEMNTVPERNVQL